MSAVRYCVVCCLSVLAALAAPTNDTPAPCCSPDQWEGYTIDLAGSFNKPDGKTAVLWNNVTTFHLDRTGSRLALLHRDRRVPAGDLLSYSEIFDFKEKTMWSFTSKNCTKGLLEGSGPRWCVPGKAQYLGQYTMFGKAIQTWFDGVTRFVVTAGDCYPIQTTVMRTSGGFRMESVSFMNVTSGIKDPSVFTPPSYCKRASLSIRPMARLQFPGFFFEGQ